MMAQDIVPKNHNTASENYSQVKSKMLQTIIIINKLYVYMKIFYILSVLEAV